MGAPSEVGQRRRDSDLGQKGQLEAASPEARDELVTSEGFVRAGRGKGGRSVESSWEVVNRGCRDRNAGCTFQLRGRC